MSQKTLSPEEWEQLVRNFCKEIARSVTRQRGEPKKIAKLLGLTPSTISDIRTGRNIGSVVVNLRLFFLKAGVSDQDAKKFLENPAFIIKSIEAPSPLDNLFNELKNLYSENELSAWFKLLISKRVVEKDLGIELKASLKKTKKN